MGLPAAARRPVDGSIVGIDRSSSLANGLVFAWSADRPSENLVKLPGAAPRQAGGAAIRTNVQSGYGTQLGTACKFFGGTEGTSDINFGALAETAGLHLGPFTCATISTVDAAFSTLGVAAWVCHSDNNSDRGFNFFSDSVYWLRLSLIRPSNGEWVTNQFQPNVGDTVLWMMSYDGGSVMTTAVKCMVNGQWASSSATSDPSGTSGAATAENLYIGRNRSGNNSAHNGRMVQTLLWNRVLADDEFRAWSGNPWQMLKVARSRIIIAASGTSGSLAATGDGQAALAGTSTITGDLTPSGTGTAALTGNSTITGDLAAAGAGQAALSGTSTLVGDLNGASDGGAAALAGSPVASGDLTASGEGGAAALAGAETDAGTLTPSGDGVAALSGTSTITGDLGATGDGQVSIIGAQPAEGDLTVASDGGAAALAGTPIVTGSLGPAGDGQAALAGTSTITGALDAAGDGQAALAGTSTVTGDLGAAGDGAAALTGSPVASGALAPSGDGAAALAGTSTETGALSSAGDGQAAIVGTSTVTGDLTAAGAGGRASLVQTNGAVSYEDEWHPDGNLGSAVWRPDYYSEPLLP